MHRFTPWFFVTAMAMTLSYGCEGAIHSPVSANDIWSEDITTEQASFSVEFADREDGRSYGLPREGQSSIADLIAIFDEELGEFTSHGFAQSAFEVGDPPLQQCRFEPAVSISRLPITVEGVVTHHPRRFFKVEVCSADEDERNWGSFTIEDDTGGVVVLRLGRTSNFTFGDRVRLTVYGIMRTFSRDADTRAVLSYDLEKLSGDSPKQDEAVLYVSTEESFTADDVTEVRRIEGYVHQAPTNRNFNEMFIATVPVSNDHLEYPESPTRDQQDCRTICTDNCRSGGCTVPAVCNEICEGICVRNDYQLPTDLPLPDACWSSNLGIELGRRGFTVPRGTKIRVTGPVVHNFSRQLWVYTPDQIEILE